MSYVPGHANICQPCSDITDCPGQNGFPIPTTTTHLGSVFICMQFTVLSLIFLFVTILPINEGIIHFMRSLYPCISESFLTL